mgnify:CR=1 FL=1
MMVKHGTSFCSSAENNRKEVEMDTVNGIAAGSAAIVKVGRNEIEVEVIGTENGRWRVRSRANGREFTTMKFERIITVPAAEAPPEIATPKPAAPAVEAPNEPVMPEPTISAPAKKLSLLDAAAKVLETEAPLNAKELVAKAIAAGLWIPTAAKTPEQSLYSAIFREIASKEVPRIVKAEVRGKFKLNPAAFADEPEA